MSIKHSYDTVIIGAGAAGLMCAAVAAQHGRQVLLMDHADKVGKKIRISGGGRCNFTNIHTSERNFISQNPRFCISALRRYSPSEFISLVESYGIAYHEKKLGQLFCDGSAQQIIDMLVAECEKNNVTIALNSEVGNINKTNHGFEIEVLGQGNIVTTTLVIATGGLSIPKMGATAFGYELAKQFGHTIIPTTAALVPFTLAQNELSQLKELAGVSCDVVATVGKTSFSEAMLVTHRGLSGPSVLQISSYWSKGDRVRFNLLPKQDIAQLLLEAKRDNPKQQLHKVLALLLPKRLALYCAEPFNPQSKIGECSDKKLKQLATHINDWSLVPNGTEGYRTAEVTLGGVNTREISSKTMESQCQAGLYFIGEVVDVTGHLGGFNFQWAWASAVAAGTAISAL